MNKIKIVSGLLIASMIVGNIGMVQTNVSAATLSEGEKEEVVYIMTDANGNTSSVNVVNILGSSLSTKVCKFFISPGF